MNLPGRIWSGRAISRPAKWFPSKSWTLRNPAVDGAIVGFRRPDQVDPILTAANLELTDDDVAEIEGGTR